MLYGLNGLIWFKAATFFQDGLINSVIPRKNIGHKEKADG